MEGTELSAATVTQDIGASSVNQPVATSAPSTTIATNRSSSNESIKDIFKSFSLIELGLGILGTAALYYVIYYYRYNIGDNKIFKVDVENKLDEIEIKLTDLSSSLQQAKKELEDQKRSPQNFF
jgi:hypothetical protein